MGRGTESLARVAVVVRARAAPLWWLGLVTAAIGALLPGLTGRRIGLLTGAALFLVTAAVTAFVHRGRYRRYAEAAGRAGRTDRLQDRRVTLRVRRRARRLPMLLAALVSIASSFALPGAAGLALAGAGAGLWAKAVWIGRLEHAGERLYWLPVDRMAGGAAGKRAGEYRTTGIAAGDAAPGGARRRRS
ncbi:hypothetical protein [Streptomyces sp. CAU 1734]|uniref:hypothetical protein n=1 Tax=Streptomyces sp. CAU 1734 TaxID=3140360 RepID=UPI0032619639